MTSPELPPLPGYRPEPRHTLAGRLKNLFVWRTPDNHLVLREIPQDRKEAEEVITFICDQWGYDRNQIILRSAEERVAFGQKASDAGLRVLRPTLSEDGSVITPYLEDTQMYNSFLQTAEQKDAEEKIHQLFVDIEKAHAQNIVYGDRWPENILIDPKRGVVHIDFDLKYGENGKELEIAKIILYTLALGVSENDQSHSRYIDAVVRELSTSRVPYEHSRIYNLLSTKIKMAPHHSHLAPMVDEVFSRLGWKHN